jgi:hypothetical protein
MAIELNRQTGAPVSPPGGLLPVSGAEFEAAFGRIRDGGISYYGVPS